jgi:hypothetical protein
VLSFIEDIGAEKVPPKVKLPVLVTVPLKVLPETVPVPPTDVTPADGVAQTPSPLRKVEEERSPEATIWSCVVSG